MIQSFAMCCYLVGFFSVIFHYYFILFCFLLLSSIWRYIETAVVTISTLDKWFFFHLDHSEYTNKEGENAERNRNRIRSVTETNRMIWIKVEILHKNIVQHAVLCWYEWLTANVAQMVCFVKIVCTDYGVCNSFL